MYLIRWRNIRPTGLLQGHNLVSTIAATGVFEAWQEREPPMTREELIGSHRQNLIEDCGRPRWRSMPFQSCMDEEAEAGPRRSPATEDDAMFPDNDADTSFQQRAGVRQTEAHQRRQERHEQSHFQVRRERAAARCTPTCSVLQLELAIAKKCRPTPNIGGTASRGL